MCLPCQMFDGAIVSVLAFGDQSLGTSLKLPAAFFSIAQGRSPAGREIFPSLVWMALHLRTARVVLQVSVAIGRRWNRAGCVGHQARRPRVRRTGCCGCSGRQRGWRRRMVSSRSGPVETSVDRDLAESPRCGCRWVASCRQGVPALPFAKCRLPSLSGGSRRSNSQRVTSSEPIGSRSMRLPSSM